VKEVAMSLAFRSDIFCRIVEDRAIILDLSGGRYFSPPASASRVLAEREAGRSDIPECEELQPLMGRGWLIERSAGALTNDFARWPVPQAALQPESDRAPRLAEILFSLLGQATVSWRLRRSSLAPFADRLRVKGRNLHETPDPSALDAHLRAFAAADRIFSPHDRCLPRSIALAQVLIDAGHSASLVLGVRANPFAAHAWVQIRDAVVGDDLDRVRTYSPILVW
jgi:hypothetical protein